MMLENVNYGRDELLFLNLCRKGYIGELLHAEVAYIHELRWQMKEEERGTDLENPSLCSWERKLIPHTD